MSSVGSGDKSAASTLAEARRYCTDEAPRKDRIFSREEFWLIVAVQVAKTRQESGPVKETPEEVVKDIRGMTRREFSVEEKIRFVLEGCVATTASLSSADVRASSKSLVSVVEGHSRSWQEATRWRPVRAATSDEVKDLNRGGLGE